MTDAKKMNHAPFVTLHSEGNIGIITLRRAQHRNALTTAMIEQLITAAITVSDDEKITAVVIEAQGDNFSVGADLNEIKAEAQAEEVRLRANFNVLEEEQLRIATLIAARQQNESTATANLAAEQAGCANDENHDVPPPVRHIVGSALAASR